MNTRSRRMNESLGSSWGDANYASNESSSVNSDSDTASELEWEESDREVTQQDKIVGTASAQRRGNQKKLSQPVPSPKRKPATPKKPANKRPATPSQTLGSSRTRQSTGSLHRTRAENHPEPSFIMPAMENPPSPIMEIPNAVPSPQVRQRMKHQPLSQEPPSTVSSFPTNLTSAIDHLAGKEKQKQEDVGPWYYAKLVWQNVLWPVSAYLLDIFSYAMRNFIRPILGVLLGIGMLVFAIQSITGVVRNSLTNVILKPVCMLPASSFFILACRDEGPQANFEELINVQGHFEDIVDASKESSFLPSSIKDTELAIRDLRTLVKYSQLPSRRELDNEFEYFILTAREASQDLARYNAHIGAAMDRVIATNQWTMNVLQGIGEVDASTGVLHSVFSAVTSSLSSRQPTLQQLIFDQYVLHISKNKDEIDTLISKATALLWILTNLDDRLQTIFTIAVNDDHTITAKRDELFSSLWTKVGGNRRDVEANKNSMLLLQNIHKYRRRAVRHVSETLVKLQEIQAELESLREGVAAPELLGQRSSLPIEYHVDLIGRAVERLQMSRGEAFRVEAQNYMKAMRGGGQGARQVEGSMDTAKTRAKNT